MRSPEPRISIYLRLQGIAHTPNPFLNPEPPVHELPSCTEPVGPAPPMSAKERMTIRMKRRILTIEPKHWSHAKALFGSMNTTRQRTKKMDTNSD